jgi:hypothetical protein
MSRFLLLLGIISVLLGGTATVAYAQEAPAPSPAPMTDAHIQRIKASCLQARANLYQLHASDGLLRVNRGELYQSFSSKLMVPFNSRAALNQLDSGKLLSITSQYGKELSGFINTYRDYEQAMSQVLELDCTKQPVAFYDGVADARQKRQKVYAHNEALRKLTRDYREAFEAFVRDFKEEDK